MKTTTFTLEEGVKSHLEHDFYPPVPAIMVAPCKKAIEKYNSGKSKSRVRLPEGVTYKNKNLIPVMDIINAYHLDNFLYGNG